MAGENGAPTATGVTSGKATDTLSQFLARILHQLELSAWLPSAALVGLVAVVLQLGTVLDTPPARGQPAPGRSPSAAINATFYALSHVTLGGALVAFAAVIVGTVLTQAFAFDAIRLLEGYWGTNPAVEWFARRHCRHHRAVLSRIDRRHRELTRRAWRRARKKIVAVETERCLRQLPPKLTGAMLDALEDEVIGTSHRPQLTYDEQKVVDNFDWERYAPPDLRRRLLNVEKRQLDYPDSSRIMPTRVGNVLRKYEADTGWRDVEPAVQNVFDELPFSRQVEHDQQRTRLDLYGSLVFVMAVVTAVGVARFVGRHPGYAAACVAVGAVLLWVMYHALIATARGYGAMLLAIARGSTNGGGGAPPTSPNPGVPAAAPVR